MKSDDSNLMQAGTQESVDQLNASFYGQFPFPWRPMKFNYLLDPDFQTLMLNQNLGDWQHRRLTPRMKIWVAGCGTNQAVITALNFPQASVVGSDLSKESLELGESTAQELGVKNLELRCESINHAPYTEEFDYIICTGVIHHNADPAATLEKLSAALKHGGVMELMVYNRYERLPTTAFQKAIRLLSGKPQTVDYEADLLRAKKIASEVKLKNFATLTQSSIDSYPDCLLADLLIQPVENSYTVESFEALGARCNLEMLYPCYDMFDKDMKTISWNMTFTDAELQRTYDALPDIERWQVTNHLLFERSPQLWFYFQRKDSDRRRKDEKQICEEFLQTRFVRTSALERSFIRQSDGHYKPSERNFSYPVSAPERSLHKLLELVDGQRTMGEIFEAVGMEKSFQQVNYARLQLSTTAFSYLKAVAGGEARDHAEGVEQVRRKMEESKLKKFRTIQPKAVLLTPDGD
ncbi:MAG: class I SAM-dependent methyltransferase [Acidobacteria bacterium]|nr:class I SAM-dependent methyltransferase [Acidobacteriota bacterium]